MNVSEIRATRSRIIEKAQANPDDLDHNFYSLVRPDGIKRKRSCLNCGIIFVSAGAGNRVCAKCKRR
jgi:hypothetical protein